MSRIRFEWNVESEKIDRFDSEAPEPMRKRRRKALALLALVVLLLAAFVLGLLLVRQRALVVEMQLAQLLQDTVKAEVAALRIGDRHSFLNVQDSEDPDWMIHQRAMFQRYSDLKADGAIELTGSILAIEVEGARARVLVQENISERPYARLWFYRRSSNSWRHVAPDYSFWGEDSELESENLRVNYRSADQALARQMRDSVDNWLKQGCALLDCDGLNRLTIEIVAEAANDLAWIDENAMRLRVRSPYVDIARADTPFDGRLQLLVSRALAERLVNAHTQYLAPTTPHDAAYLREAAISWLSERFTRFDSGALLMRSLADNYGEDKIAQLLSQLSAASGLEVVEAVIGVPLASANLDWRDFVEWRLALEAELIEAGRQNDCISLYDTADESARLAAYERCGGGATRQNYRVIDQLVWTAPAGAPQLRATVRLSGDASALEEIVLFNLAGGGWKRAN